MNTNMPEWSELEHPSGRGQTLREWEDQISYVTELGGSLPRSSFDATEEARKVVRWRKKVGK